MSQARRPAASKIARDPSTAASKAGLRYVNVGEPGLTRRRASARTFRYVDAKGRVVTDVATLARIRSLVIPPAWTDVWICVDPEGHIQVTGRDVKGRKQYRYHPRWREVRDDAKYGRMVEFARALPKLRTRTERDLRRPGLPRDKVLATVVRLLERTLIRVGNEEYVRQNRSFGLTTMRDHHVDIAGSRLRFRFRGKSGKMHEIGFQDRRLSGIVKRCQDVPGQELFQYVGPDGRRRTIESDDVNRYLREATGQDFTAKDFRTWAGTVRAAWELRDLAAAGSQNAAKKNVTRAIESVARRLGNTPTICRKSYIHPAVIDSYMESALLEPVARRARKELASHNGLRPQESVVLKLLVRRMRGEVAPQDLEAELKASLAATPASVA